MGQEKAKYEEAIKKAEKIARTGSAEEKADFVGYISLCIGFNSAQGNYEAVDFASSMYKAYLRALTE